MVRTACSHVPSSAKRVLFADRDKSWQVSPTCVNFFWSKSHESWKKTCSSHAPTLASPCFTQKQIRTVLSPDLMGWSLNTKYQRLTSAATPTNPRTHWGWPPWFYLDLNQLPPEESISAPTAFARTYGIRSSECQSQLYLNDQDQAVVTISGHFWAIFWLLRWSGSAN